VERFERAVPGPAIGKTSHTAAQAGIDTMASGLEAARMLDVIVANQFRRDPVTHAVWKTRRRIDTGRRGRGRSVSPHCRSRMPNRLRAGRDSPTAVSSRAQELPLRSRSGQRRKMWESRTRRTRR